MKVAIIGAAGKVGAATAFALQVSAAARELALIDVAENAVQGEALDLLHGSALCGPLVVRAGGYDAAAGSDIVVISAGLRRHPDESRLQLMSRNASLFREILERLSRVSLAPGAILVVVTNPVDIMTRIALDAGWPPRQTVGTGTLLDTVRLRSLLAARLGADPRVMEVLVLGEHGDSMVPIWSRAHIGGAALNGYPGFSEALRDEVFRQVKSAGAEMIRLKGGAAYAIALCVREVVEAIASDARRVLPLSTLQQGAYGIEGVCLSLPTVIGRDGVCEVQEPPLLADEVAGLRASAAVLRDTLRTIAQQ